MPRRLEKEELIKLLRNERKQVCFPIINRGKLWYDCLTNEQLAELKNWYWDWLNVTTTLVIPVTPLWLKNKIYEEEIVI